MQRSAPVDGFSQAASVVGLIGELGLGPAVIAGCDVGSRVAQQIARRTPEVVRALVVAPPLPGAGDRVLSPDAAREFWYQHFHRLIARSLGEQAPAPDDRIALPTTVLWPEHDPLFPPAWSDRLDEFFSSVALQLLPGAGHFSPLEAPDRFTQWIQAAL
jgi:pimeloyl-ACP methyl ester carboxylesterase